MLYSTTRLRFTLPIIGASLTLNHLQEIDVMQASARDMQLILATIWLLAKAGISMYFTCISCFSKSSAREDSCPAVKSAAALSLAEFLPWRADLNRKSYMAILRESPTLRDLGSMDDYDLIFVYVDFITGLGMMAQNIATRRSRSNSQTHRMSLFCLMGNMGAHDRSDPMALPLGCCLGVVRWILKLVTIVSHTQSHAHQPSQHKCHYALCLSRCLTCS